MQLTTILTELFSDLGPMSWPLLLCSAITLTLVIERVFNLVFMKNLGSKKTLNTIHRCDPKNEQQCDQLIDSLSTQKSLFAQGLNHLLKQRHLNKVLREDSAGMWLAEKRTQLKTGLKVLSLIGVISPLLGLLGTVLGLIEMFKAVALTTGSVAPSDLADGLGLAMRTTAVGLLIALPAICSAQLLGIWADKITYKLEHALNHCNLWIEGVDYSEKATAKGSKNIKPTAANVS